jgi:hypothetical protein
MFYVIMSRNLDYIHDFYLLLPTRYSYATQAIDFILDSLAFILFRFYLIALKVTQKVILRVRLRTSSLLCN